MESIMTNDKEHCFLCGRTGPLQIHHCIHGTSNRKNSEHYGLKVPLCMDCHTGSNGVHQNRKKDLQLIILAQMEFEKNYGGRDEFIKVFGRSWL